MITLYHYLHCPFCIRIRLVLGFLDVPYKSVVLDYDDELTPVNLCGAKMLPIIQKEDGTCMNESMDIIDYIDKESILSSSEECHNFLTNISKELFALSMPYMIYSPEFNESSRDYFRKKKESGSRGPFTNLVKDFENLNKEFSKKMNKFEQELKPFYQSEKIGLDDLLIASHLWGMYLVPEFQFSNKIHEYLQKIKSETNFDYMGECWK